MRDLIDRQAAIDAFCKECYDTDGEICDRDDVCGNVMILKGLPSAQPEYYDYSDIDDVWDFYAEEQDINLTDGAKQIKDAMWVGYRKGKQDAQPEIIRCKECIHRPQGTGVNHDITFPDWECPCQCDDYWYSWMPDDDWFCPNGERREDEQAD